MKYIILIFLLAIVSCNDAEDDETVQEEPQGLCPPSGRHDGQPQRLPRTEITTVYNPGGVCNIYQKQQFLEDIYYGS